MNEIIKQTASDFLPIFHSSDNIADIPKPFAREIYLFDTHVAGTSHVDNIKELEPDLNIDDKLVFYREPENDYDPEAIRIENLTGDKIGYVPKADNVVFARLMDAGKLLFAKISHKEMKGNWLKLDIKIYLED